MAQRSGRPRTFRNDPKLKQYFLEVVVPTGKSLGVGSYGSVVEVEYKRTPCAAKQMHKLLLDPDTEGVRDIIQRYQRECQLMAGLRHPNITQFLGLCSLESSQLPLLVMERLEMNVNDLLECSPNIPLPVKLSILTDTCSGLVYLHGMEPYIVHRDLTARNVLLNSALSAKITDLGNSRMVNMRPGQLARTLSKLPGTLVYMPPEALNDSHRYGPSLDVFSFGHLSLYTLTQVFPGELLAATDMDPNDPGRVIGRTEVERREAYMNDLKGHFSNSHNALVELVSQCLHNNPQHRPSSEGLLGRLHALKVEVDKLYGNMGKEISISGVLVMKEVKMKDKAIKDLQISEERLEDENRELMAARGRLEEEKRNLAVDNAKIRDDKNQLQIEKNQLYAEKVQVTDDKNRVVAENSQLKSENNQLKFENNQLKSEKQQLQLLHEAEKRQLVAQNQSLEAILQEFQKSQLVPKIAPPQKRSGVKFPLKLNWRRGPDMPSAMSGFLQSVEVEGAVYVGGGWTGGDKGRYVVMAYDMKSSKWHKLPSYSAKRFAMTTLNNKLVLVGGHDSHNQRVNQLGMWQTDSSQWTRPFPPMPTPRYDTSAISYKHWLVVAGGYSGGSLSTVEVLDVDNKQWYTAPSTPTPWDRMKSTVIGDTWYLMGGCCGLDDIPDVYSVSLEALVSHSTSDNSNTWRKLPSLDCTRSCPINIGESLLALGGCSNQSRNVSSIQRLVPETDSWVLAGELLHQVVSCTGIMIGGKLHVFGGYSDSDLSTYYIGNILK